MNRYHKACIISLAIIGLCVFNSAVAQKFTIPVLPDTQGEVNPKPEMLTSQLKWIVEKKDSLNIPFVLHLGDIVDYDNIGHWGRSAMSLKFSTMQKILIHRIICPL